jgi:hypothetical protein
MSKHLKKFGEAIEQACKSDMTEKHGAVCVLGGKTLSRGYNSTKPLNLGCYMKFGRLVHAEMSALLKLKYCEKDRFKWERSPKTSSGYIRRPNSIFFIEAEDKEFQAVCTVLCVP